jgi:DDE superfamily endonuclease
LAKHLGISFAAVARAWRDYGVQPWRAQTVKFSTDPELVGTVTAIVGLSLASPENAVVLCVEEKSQIQALDRTQPMLPMQPGRPERRTHDYVRQGTTTLVAAVAVATGQVSGMCQDRHRHQEFLKVLQHLARTYPDQDLHLVMDNYATHNRRGARLAGRQPAHPPALHPLLGVLAQPGRSVVFHHQMSSHPPRQLRQRARTDHRHQDLHHRLEPARAPIRVDENRG